MVCPWMHRFVLISFSCFSAAGIFLMPFSASTWDSARIHDPVVVKGILFSRMAGESPADLRLFAMHEGAMVLIPHQIDERMKVNVYRGWTEMMEVTTYAFNQGPKLMPDPDPGFDRDDELAFMARDLGARAGPEGMPEGAKFCEEIEVSDPGLGSGYVYLCSFDSPPPPSGTSYVSFDEGTNRFSGTSYRVGYPASDLMAFDELHISGAGGGSPDLLDTMKLEIDMRALMGLLVYRMTKDDYTHFLRGMKIGPVRIIKEMETVLEALFNLQIRVIHHVYYYPEHIENVIVSRTELYWGGIHEANYVFTLDLTEAAEGMKFYSDTNPAGVTIDGVMDTEELALDYGPAEWVAASGGYGTIYGHLAVPNPEGLPPDKILYADLYYADARFKPNPPEDERGMYGKFGFTLRNLLERTGGKPVPFRLIFFFDPRAHRAGMEREYMTMYKSPLEVRVNHHLASGLEASPAPPEDLRGPEERPRPSLEPRMETISATRFFAPSFLFDPYYLGTGVGISYTDLDFMGTGLFLGLLTLTSERNFHWYMIDFQKLRFIPFVEDFRVFLQFQQFPSESFYGLGNESDEDHHVLYWWKRYEAFVTFRKHFSDHYGIDTELFFNDVEIDPGQKAVGIESAPSIEEHFGFDDELTGERWGGPLYGFEGGMSNGVKISLYRDFRDDYQCPHRGNYQAIELKRVGPETGSDFNYLQVWLDVRAYAEPDWLQDLPIDRLISPRRTLLNKYFGPEKHRSLAGALRLGSTFSEDIEFEGQEVLDMPFYETMRLGGSSRNRGFQSSRFRDNDYALLSLEYRWVYWRFTDMAFFYDAGMVMEDMFEEESRESDIHQGYGVSIRAHIPPGVIATFEYAFSEDYPSGWFVQANWVF